MSRYVIVGSTGDIGKKLHEQLSTEETITFSREKEPEYESTHHFLDLSHAQDKTVIEGFFNGVDGIDGLIWCPGYSLFSLVQDTALDEVDAQYNISIRNLVAFIQVLLPKLRRKKGRIIVITSIWGRHGASYESIYASMKGAQEALIKSLAKELAPTGVTVNGVAPGIVEGSMTALLSEADQHHLLEELPQACYVKPAEVMHAVQYLLHENAQSVTGEIMNVNGGWYT
ncbi:SDR family oxidoreductase [Salinicoccus jeotgali]|uniref:SDR family oxidoreductase n=1 Tax=Salinicoccus jeotgali TaxID=381634 RepID=A0ABP7EKL2_9STAP